MTDQEREARAIWMLHLTGWAAQRSGGWWLITERCSGAEVRVGSLGALILLAGVYYTRGWRRGLITPSA